MKILIGEKEREALRWLSKTEEIAQHSLCLRSRCGSIIVRGGLEIIGEGYNSPPQNKPEFRVCLQEYDIPKEFRHDRTCCIHAEQRALQNAERHGNGTRGASLYFLRIDGHGARQISTGNMKCTICTRAMLDKEISEFIIFCADGVRAYTTQEAYELSYRYKTPLR